MKSLLTPILIFILLITGMSLQIITPDENISETERRRLKQFPAFAYSELLNSDYYQTIESYLLDQFILRDRFRSLNALMRYHIYNQNDINEIYIIDDVLYRMDYPLNENSINHATNLIQYYRQTHFKDHDVYYGIIPDKNYFVKANQGYLKKDYDKLLNLVDAALFDLSKIDLFQQVKAHHYYRTDHHLAQEEVIALSHFLLEQLGQDISKKPSYQAESHYPFHGAQYGHAALKLKPDTLTYLINETTKKAYRMTPQNSEKMPIYDKEALESLDPYSLFLGGIHPINTVHNPMADSNQSLIIFGDSYANSLIPLLLEGYQSITMIDLRYASESAINTYLEFSDQDILFLYSTTILNDSWALD